MRLTWKVLLGVSVIGAVLWAANGDNYDTVITRFFWVVGIYFCGTAVLMGIITVDELRQERRWRIENARRYVVTVEVDADSEDEARAAVQTEKPVRVRKVVS